MSSKSILLLMACAAGAAASPAVAAETTQVPVIEANALIPATVEIAVAEVTIADPDLLDDDELLALRGGEALVVSNQTLTAITSGNVINGNYTAGNVSLADQALSSFNGVGNLLINTGGQVSLQTGMNLTINVGE